MSVTAKTTTHTPLAIVGVSGRYPKADNLEVLWTNLKAGVDGVGEAKGDRWEFFGLSPREAQQVDPQHRLMLELSWEAMESAGMVPADLAGSKTGVFIGICNNDYCGLGGQDKIDAYTNIGSALSSCANRISYQFDLHGPSMAIDTACSSSMVAMHQACRAIESGECRMAFVGGVNILASMKPWIGFAQALMLSPDGRCTSFDGDGAGYVRAEGGGVVIVKPLTDAERDGDPILAVILGTGVNSDGRTIGMAMPSVAAHGAGTAVGDSIECGAIGRVLGALRADGSTCLIGLAKSNIGHLVLQEYRPAAPAAAIESKTPTAEDWSDLLLLSAHSPEALEDVATAYAGFLSEAQSGDWRNVCAAVALSRARHLHRLAVAAATPQEAAARLKSHLAGEKTSRLAKGKASAAAPKLALVYSGNGPQWWGMGRELFAESAIFRGAIDEIDALFAPKAGWSLAEEMRRPEADSRIGLTEIAQPLLFAQQVALTKVLSAAGIAADAVLGHSVGEAAAAWASGALTLEQATDVIFHRSQMQALTAGRGRMAALGVGPEEATQAMAEIGGWLEIAAINSPRAVTVAGALDALEILRDRLTDEGKFVRILPLNYPFHTQAMDSIEGPLLLRLDGLAPSSGDIPFISTVTGATIDGSALNGDYWWRNVRKPVQFEAAVAHALADQDIGLFLEVGPHPVLKEYLQQTIKAADGASAVALSTLRRPGTGRPAPEMDTLKTAICSVYAVGGGEPKALFDRPRIAAKLPLSP